MPHPATPPPSTFPAIRARLGDIFLVDIDKNYIYTALLQDEHALPFGRITSLLFSQRNIKGQSVL